MISTNADPFLVGFLYGLAALGVFTIGFILAFRRERKARAECERLLAASRSEVLGYMGAIAQNAKQANQLTSDLKRMEDRIGEAALALAAKEGELVSIRGELDRTREGSRATYLDLIKWGRKRQDSEGRIWVAFIACEVNPSPEYYEELRFALQELPDTFANSNKQYPPIADMSMRLVQSMVAAVGKGESPSPDWKDCVQKTLALLPAGKLAEAVRDMSTVATNGIVQASVMLECLNDALQRKAEVKEPSEEHARDLESVLELIGRILDASINQPGLC